MRFGRDPCIPRTAARAEEQVLGLLEPEMMSGRLNRWIRMRYEPTRLPMAADPLGKAGKYAEVGGTNTLRAYA